MTDGERSLARIERADREERAWKLRLAGKTEREIALTLNMSQPGVHAMLDRVERRVLADAKAMVLRIKARQHGRLEALYVEALAAYERSKQEAVRSTTEGSPGGPDANGKPTVSVQKIRREAHGRDGDPAWFGVLCQIHDRIVALWGLNAPTRTLPPREPDPVETMSDAAVLAAAERELAEERRQLEARQAEGAA